MSGRERDIWTVRKEDRVFVDLDRASMAFSAASYVFVCMYDPPVTYDIISFVDKMKIVHQSVFVYLHLS